jgi:RNA polymerase alpha subunit
MPSTAPGGTVSELGLPARAVSALTRAGITTTAQLAALTRAELVAVNGLGPGTVAAIRRVVPEPPGRLPAAPAPAPAPPPALREEDQESPAAPAIPSFESLRSPRRRTTVDLIVPATPPPADPTPAAPRPPDYADLWRLGVRVGSTVAALPVRLTLCAVRAPARRVRRLLGRP